MLASHTAWLAPYAVLGTVPSPSWAFTVTWTVPVAAAAGTSVVVRATTAIATPAASQRDQDLGGCMRAHLPQSSDRGPGGWPGPRSVNYRPSRGGPSLVALAVAVPQFDRGAVAGGGTGDVEAQSGLDAGDGAVGVEVPLLGRAAV